MEVEKGRVCRFHGYRLGWGADVATKWAVGGGQAVRNSVEGGWGLPSHILGRNDSDVAP